MNSIEKTIDGLISVIRQDSYILTRDDIDSIEWRLIEVKDYISNLYKKRRGEEL